MGVVRTKLVNHPLQILTMGVISGLESLIIYPLMLSYPSPSRVTLVTRPYGSGTVESSLKVAVQLK